MKDDINIDEILATINGRSLEEYRREMDFRNEIHAKSLKYLNKNSSEWPPINFNWDVSIESQRFSLDGTKKEEFLKYYPEGFSLGYVALSELDSVLCHYSRRDEGELWELGCSSKLASLIVYLSEGHPIAPPLVKPLEDCSEVIFQGGHHRYAIAKEIGERNIPIHVEPQFKNKIDLLLKVSWKNT